jgi:hypothetical protein
MNVWFLFNGCSETTLRRIVVPRLSHSMPPQLSTAIVAVLGGRVSAKKNVRMRDILTLSKKRVSLIIGRSLNCSRLGFAELVLVRSPCDLQQLTLEHCQILNGR